jgi:hypothetical protein
VLINPLIRCVDLTNPLYVWISILEVSILLLRPTLLAARFHPQDTKYLFQLGRTLLLLNLGVFEPSSWPHKGILSCIGSPSLAIFPIGLCSFGLIVLRSILNVFEFMVTVAVRLKFQETPASLCQAVAKVSYCELCIGR